MPLQCPQCQSGILAQQIDKQLQAICSQCGAIFSLADQLEGLLAYHHPGETQLAPPPGLRLEYLPDETVQIKLPQPLSAPLPWPFASLTSLAGTLNEVVVTANQKQLALYDVPLPGLALNKKQFAAGQIEQLYLKKVSTASPVPGELRSHYELWALLSEPRTELLLQLEDWAEALYLEQKLESTLGLRDRLVDGEVSYLSSVERRKLLEWWPLAESLSLNFIPQVGGGYFTGLYRRHQFRLDAFPQPYGTHFIVYTRLTLHDERLLQQKIPSEEAIPLAEPPTSDVLQLLLIPPDWKTDVKCSLEIQSDGRRIYYEQVGIETDPTYLKFLFELLSRLAEAYPQILAWGGAAVPALQEMLRLKPWYLNLIAGQLLNEIQQETSQRLFWQPSKCWCPHCLVRRVGQIEIQDSWPPRHYYGCQLCGQSRTFFRGGVIAVLDQQMEVQQLVQAEARQILVNWLHYRTMFDFDEVRLIRADDEAVERLAMQIGNDTDPQREVQRKTTTCIVAPECQLSENTWKILQRTFWQVKKG